MKILAFDQASKNTAFAIGENGKLADYGMLVARGEKDDRVYNMATLIEEKIKEVNPDIVLFENIQLQTGNVKTYQILAHLQGMLIYIIKKLSLSYSVIAPVTWKIGIGINNKLKRDGQKAECIKIIESKYNIDLDSNDDLADAIGILTYFMEKGDK